MNEAERIIKMTKALRQDKDLLDIYARADSIVECAKHLNEKLDELNQHTKALPEYEVLKEKNWQAIDNINAAAIIIERIVQTTQENLNYMMFQAELIQNAITTDTEHLLALKDTDAD